AAPDDRLGGLGDRLVVLRVTRHRDPRRPYVDLVVAAAGVGPTGLGAELGLIARAEVIADLVRQQPEHGRPDDAVGGRARQGQVLGDRWAVLLVNERLGRARRPFLRHRGIVGGREVAGEKHRRLRLFDAGKHRAPGRHRALADTVVGELCPPQLLDLGLEARRDHSAVRALAADDRVGLDLGVEQARVEGAVYPVGEALAVPGLGRVALEDAPVLARVALVAVDPRDLGVDVVVQGPGVGDDVELGP